MKFTNRHLITTLMLGFLSNHPALAAEGLGYQDTPKYPGSKWHIHDGERPQPKIVAPGEFSTQAKVGNAPSDAVVLFDGKDLST